ncbi:hypothetical protein GQ53DRAFT_822325 [Thozetella sp. PMI_491]|nr:hypothetical protein GQ53DRAFT_822325 [Thozetella sp. PMI_491]
MAMESFAERLKAMEEKIPVEEEIYFVVNCPSLHLIPGGFLDPGRHYLADGLWGSDRYFCPQCKQVVTRSRQISGGSRSIPSRSIPTTPSPGAIYSLPIIQGDPNPVRKYSPSPAHTPVQLGATPPSMPAQESRTSLSRSSPDSRLTQVLSHPSSLMISGVSVPNFRPYSPALPEVVQRPEDFGPERALVPKAPSIFSGRNPRFPLFRRSGTSEKPANWRQSTSSASGDSTELSLPKLLCFSFSTNGENLLLWKKESECLVRIELASSGGRQIDLTGLLSGNGLGGSLGIRYAAEGDTVIVVVATYNRNLVLGLLDASGLPHLTNLQQLDGRLEPYSLAISPNNSFVALALGVQVLLFAFNGFELLWKAGFEIPELRDPAAVRFQACSFASDSASLVVSTQRTDRQRSSLDDVVQTYVWKCQDARGLTSIHYSPSLSTAFISGLTATRYPMFLAHAAQPALPLPKSTTEFRVLCSCIAPPPDDYVVYFLDITNKLFHADLRSRKIEMIADLSRIRGILKVSEEPATLGVTSSHRLTVFWRQGPGLWALDVERGRVQTKRNLRELWRDSVGD